MMKKHIKTYILPHTICVHIIPLYIAFCLILSGCVLGPSPADSQALNHPVYKPIANSQCVTIEVIRVNGQKTPGKSFEKAVETFSQYVAGKVQVVESEPVQLDLGDDNALTKKQLKSVIKQRKHHGASSIAFILTPGFSFVDYSGHYQYQNMLHGKCASHVIVISARSADRKATKLLASPELIWEVVMLHELCHSLHIPADRSHRWDGGHCTHPECILYPKPNLRSILTSIMRLGPPRKLCKICESEIQQTHQAAKGKLYDPDQPDTLMTYIDELVRLNPGRAEVYVQRAHIYLHSKDYPHVIADITKAIEIDPDNPKFYTIRAYAYDAQKDYTHAIEDLAHAIDLDLNNAVRYRNRAVVYDHQCHYTKAINDYEKAIQLSKSDYESRNLLAWIFATCPKSLYRNGPRAIELATQACKLTDWNEATYLDTLAAAYAEQGEFKAAIQYQTKAMALANQQDAQEHRDRLQMYKIWKPYRE